MEAKSGERNEASHHGDHGGARMCRGQSEGVKCEEEE